MSWSRWIPSPFGGGRPEEPKPTAAYYDRDDTEHLASYTPSDQYSHYQPGRHGGRREEGRGAHRSVRDHDILIFRYKNTNYPLKFPAYSIDDRRLTVGYAREQAAETLRIDDIDSLKMIHKGKRLDSDAAFFSDLGFRSDKPSEIFCNVSAAAPLNRPPEGSDTSEGEEEDEGRAGGEPGAGGRRRKSKKKKRKNKGGAAPSSASASPAVPYPTGNVEYLPMPSGTHPMARTPSATSHAPTATPTPSSSSGGAAPSSTTTSSTSASSPALARLSSIASNFHTTLVPQCVTYMHSPPADAAKRRFEHKKLTETIMSQVMLKLDAVETEGDGEARARRKELVREAQGMMNRLDESLGGLAE